jgi:uncharacterized protein with gpF-like domain
MKAKEINELKLPLEAKLSNKIYKVFKNQANDVARLFLVDKLNATELADNYRPEMLKEVRDGLRMSIGVFGYSLRNSIEKQFNIAFKSIDNSEFDNVNRQLELDFTLFVANQSENQADLITNTSAKEIDNIVVRQTQIKAEEISLLIREQNQLSLLATDKARQRIAQIEMIVRNAKRDIAKNIKINLLDNAKSRARLIGEQVIGIGEAYSRDNEANVVNNAKIKTNRGTMAINKTWVAILDKSTREAHMIADGQEVKTNDKFIVDGESLNYPRDPNGSSANVIRCRCVAIYDKKYFN